MKWGESEGGEGGGGGGIENEKGEKEGRKLGMSRPEWTGGREGTSPLRCNYSFPSNCATPSHNKGTYTTDCLMCVLMNEAFCLFYPAF